MATGLWWPHPQGHTDLHGVWTLSYYEDLPGDPTRMWLGQPGGTPASRSCLQHLEALRGAPSSGGAPALKWG